MPQRHGLDQGPWPLLLLALAGVLQAASLAWPGLADGAGWGAWLDHGAPQPWLQWLSMAVMVRVLLWAPSAARAAAWMAWCATVAGVATTWWLYISMVHYGGLLPWAGAAAVVALSAFLAWSFALLGAAFFHVRHRPSAPLWWACGWLLAEWLRGVVLTGFPWGNIATAHVDGLGVFAPWLGALGVGALAAGLAAWLGTRQGLAAVLTAAAVGGVAVAPAMPWHDWDWSQTQATGPARVTLLQGNINQADKFDAERGVPQALRWYREAIAAAEPSDLVVAPETAIPVLPQTLNDDYWRGMAETLAAQPAAVAMGVPLGSAQAGYENALWWMTPSLARAALTQPRIEGQDLAEQHYAKVHLVPFGEYTPTGFRWFAAALNMPLSGFRAGALDQAPFEWAGQQWGVQICYEDVFGAELARRMVLAAPSIWVNVSNIAWFGDTIAVEQHLNIARWRARETGRAIVRATNTGATAAIDHLGRVHARLPAFTRDRLSVDVVGRQALTPYVRWVGRWRDAPWVVLAVLPWLWLLGQAWRGRGARGRHLQ
jgi:apolipoprotein N-acyltransferase